MTKWIKCTDRLPEINQRVLSYDVGEFTVLIFRGDHWLNDIYGYTLSYITHWMPLPLPPGEEK